jgi:hypothetical protein
MGKFKTIIMFTFLLIIAGSTFYTNYRHGLMWASVQKFMLVGDRFTSDDGDVLKARIAALEAACDADPAGCR